MIGLLGGEVEPRYGFERFPLVCAALLLELAKFGDFLFAAAHEARLLELEIAELLFVFDERLHFDHAGPQRGFVLVEALGEFDVALREEGGFERGNALKTPDGVGDGLDEIGFALTDGREIFGVGAEVALVFGCVVARQKNGAAGEARLDGVQRGFGAAFSRRGTGG